jgi:hypothetical protein
MLQPVCNRKGLLPWGRTESGRRSPWSLWVLFAPPARLERATCGLEVRCSIQLSYGGRTCEPGGARGAGEGDRTLMTSLEGWSSAIELHPRVTARITIVRRQSGWPDLNRRLLAPKASALPSCATARGPLHGRTEEYGVRSATAVSCHSRAIRCRHETRSTTGYRRPCRGVGQPPSLGTI